EALLNVASSHGLITTTREAGTASPMPGMLGKSRAPAPRYHKFASISLQRRVERTPVRDYGTKTRGRNKKAARFRVVRYEPVPLLGTIPNMRSGSGLTAVPRRRRS